ncbi:MAG TPA: hypothetical protein VF125_06280 [Solirubrobacterales bacterium]
MQANRLDASDGAAEVRRSSASPGNALGQLRADEAGEHAELRERAMEAVLLSCGELGYRKLTVAAVLKRYGGYRMQFYRLFGNVDECYAAAYELHSGLLAERLLSAGAKAPDWRTGLRAALEELARFARQQPHLGLGLLSEVHSAGIPALARRREVLERLSRAIDSARRETESRHSPPPLTAPFMVGAIESTVVRALARDEPELFERAIPELEQLVGTAYFDDRLGSR